MSAPSMLYGTAWKEDRTEALTFLALQTGFRGVDTANQRRHYHEAGAGKGIQQAIAAGICSREELFLQTKFTYQRGQDHRLPYDPSADLPTQVRQSMTSSLEHLATSWVDSYVLHGPASGHGWTQEDAAVWETMSELMAAGQTRALGVSNVGLQHLQTLWASHASKPSYVQNRCFARTGWDRAVRRFCSERGVAYQGFSLLTANPEVVYHPAVAAIATRLSATPAQVVLRFAQQVGMLPLTGTTDPEHMRQDLACQSLQLAENEVRLLESLAG